METRNEEIIAGDESADVHLPSALAGCYMVCKCFGVGTREMGHVLSRWRKQSPKPDEEFPNKISTELLRRATSGKGKWQSAVGVVVSEALYDRLLREGKPGSASKAAHFAEKVSNSLLQLYQAILPKLRVDGIPTQRVLWVLIEEVFAPVLLLELKMMRGRGFGNEYDIDSCWYLPRIEGTEIIKPFPRVFENWMHAAGYRGAYDFGKVSDSVRKKLEGWINGKHVPGPVEIRSIVGEYAKEFRDFGDPEDWIGRLGLAAGMHNLCDECDHYFASLFPNASLRLAEMISDQKTGEVAVDVDESLLGLRSFFAARLVQRRWKADETWEKKILSDPPNPPAPAQNASDEEWVRFKYETERVNNHGSRFVDALLTEINIHDGRPPEEEVSYIRSEEYLFERGVEELNTILDKQRCGGQTARRT